MINSRSSWWIIQQLQKTGDFCNLPIAICNFIINIIGRCRNNERVDDHLKKRIMHQAQRTTTEGEIPELSEQRDKIKTRKSEFKIYYL